jgi:hypothetical protein
LRAIVRQLAGRNGEVWGAESAGDKLFVIKSEQPSDHGRTPAPVALPIEELGVIERG